MLGLVWVPLSFTGSQRREFTHVHTRLTYLVRDSRKALLTQTLTSSTVSRRVAAVLADEAWGGEKQKAGYHISLV